MTDIGNKANVLQNAKNLNNKGIKKEVVKPARGLTKQKATTSLAKLSDATVFLRRPLCRAQPPFSHACLIGLLRASHLS